jgi:hypothetical protein
MQPSLLGGYGVRWTSHAQRTRVPQSGTSIRRCSNYAVAY